MSAAPQTPAANDNNPPNQEEPETVRVRYPLHPDLQAALDNEHLFD